MTIMWFSLFLIWLELSLLVVIDGTRNVEYSNIKYLQRSTSLNIAFHDRYTKLYDDLVKRSHYRMLLMTQKYLQNDSESSNQLLQHRNLQTNTFTSQCVSNDTVSFEDDDFLAATFDTTFQPSCTCSEQDNYDDINGIIDELDFSNINAFVDGFNAAVGKLVSSSEYTCRNNCETCFDGVCGIVETRESLFLSNSPSNFTLDEIVSGDIEFRSLIANITYIYSHCITYTANADGTLCFGEEFSGVPILDTSQDCYVEYNDERCNSCIFPLSNETLSDDGCFVADCTNLNVNGVSTMLDSCDNTTVGFVGPFKYLEFVEGIVDNSTIYLGSCNIQPTAPSVSFPSSPNDVPVQPPSTSISTPTIPTNMPEQIREPSAPVDINTLPTTSMTTPVAISPNAPIASQPTSAIQSTSSATSATYVFSRIFLMGFFVVNAIYRLNVN